MATKRDWHQAQKNRLAKIAWLSVNRVGRATFRHLGQILKKRRWSWFQAWEASSELLRMDVLTECQSREVSKFKQQWPTPEQYADFLHERGIKGVLFDDECYPALLREIVDHPEVLFVKGDVENLRTTLPIAVVGTRKMTFYGRHCTEKLTRELTMSGATIISGFMYGVDVTAQQIAWRGGGKTVGVLGFGLDHCFPRSQNKLMREMIAAGQTFITEYAPWVMPKAGLFPERNRIVAGMSRGVLVTEAAASSGSLITANLAVEMGREVWAVPGPITNPYSEGTRQLLKDGATLVSSGAEIIKDLVGEWGQIRADEQQNLPEKQKEVSKNTSLGLSDEAQLVMNCLKKSPLGLTWEQLCEETRLTPAQVQSLTMRLNLDQRIKIAGELVVYS